MLKISAVYIYSPRLSLSLSLYLSFSLSLSLVHSRTTASRLEVRGEDISNRETWHVPLSFAFFIENYLLPRLASSSFDALISRCLAPVSRVRAYNACLVDPVAWINISSNLTDDLWRKSKTHTFPSPTLFSQKTLSISSRTAPWRSTHALLSFPSRTSICVYIRHPLFSLFLSLSSLCFSLLLSFFRIN